jgi:hypothetical protein
MKCSLSVSGFENKILIQELRKFLLHDYIPIMVTVFESDVRKRCITDRAIYVMLRGNEETRTYINQVRNLLRNFSLSVILSTYIIG